MSIFSVPGAITESLFPYTSIDEFPDDFYRALREKFSHLRAASPEVSIVMPVWNEEKNLLNTLHSLAQQRISRPTEIIIVNNNSTDRTQEILDRCGVHSVFEPKQGITNARQAGLDAAKGRYLLCADGDTVYPPGWSEALVKGLEQAGVSVVHGTHGFIPPGSDGRTGLFFYEHIREAFFLLRRKRHPYLNVFGFNNGFHTELARKVGGYNKDRQIWEDGWMARELMQFGKILRVSSDDAKVWTSARRLMLDGSISKAFLRRVKKEISHFGGYIFNRPVEKF